MKIYTRTGDKGETSLFTGQRLKKNDPFFEALGTVDECNSAVGVAISLLPDLPEKELLTEQLETIQHALFDVGAALATPRTRAVNNKLEKTRFDNEEIESLENWIDAFNVELPPLKTFILPGGCPAGATLHMARSICRRAERLTVPLHDRHDVAKNVLMYLNRLSDYLFVASRFVNYKASNPETPWQPHKLTQTS